MPRILQIIILLLLPLVAVGREPVSPKTFVNINIENEAGEVYYSLCQDSTGMIWLGTNMGLYGYDGYRMHKRFNDVPGSNTNINCIVVRDSLLYAGADTGVFVYDLTKDEHIPRGIVFPTDVRSLAFDGDYLWIGSLKGLYRFDSVRDTLQDFSEGLPHSAVYAVKLTRHGDLYVGTYNGLCRYDRKNESFEKVNIAKPYNKKNLFVNALADDEHRKCLWIGTEGALYRYDYDSGKVSQLGLFDGCSVKSLTLDHKGNLIAGTDNGLFIYSRHRFERYRHDSRIATSLSNNVVWSVMVDRDGNLWAGTESGLSEWVNSGDFALLPLYQLAHSSDGCRFYTIFRDSRGYLWLGGTNGIIRRSRDGQVKWYMMESKDYPLKHNRVRSICEDSRYELWIASDGGINRYDYIKEQFVNYAITDSSHTYNANWAYGVVEDYNGMMWVGSYLGGLFAVDRNRLVASTSEYVADRCYNSANGMPNNMINQVALSRDGSKWVSSYKSGAIVKIGKGDTMKVLDVCDSYVQYIVPDRRTGGLWCGYHNGFAFVSDADTVQGRFTFPLAADIEIYSMEVVKDDLWISTSHGVWVMNEGEGQVKHLRLPGRLYTSLYYDRASRKVLLGGDEELLVVDPSISHRREEGKPIKVTALYVNDEPYQSAKPMDIGNISSLRLSHDQNRLMIEFSDFDYRLDNRKDFEYRIRGISDDWHSLEAGNNRILISNIPPGEYVLEIRPLDVAEASIKTIDISVSPAWYCSWWAIVVYALLGILLILWIMNFLRLRLRLRVERVRSEKTIEMVKNRMDFLTNISHELKTPLSMIIGPLSKMINDEKSVETRRRLDAIQQNALKINSLIHRALEVNRMDENPDNLLIYSQVEMASFCRSIFDTYREAFPTKKFSFNCSADRIMMSVDVVKIESVINNILSNACKYSGDDASVTMSLQEKEGNVEISIRDNGVGIPADDLPFIFQRLYQSSATIGHKDGTGIGLYLAKTYVEMHHGLIRVQSEPGTGSTFTIILPVGEANETYQAEAEATVAADNSASDKSCILIVEDNAAIAAFVKEILKPDYKCVVADNGKAGLDLCGSVVPDLIIVDEMMPVMSGIEMCRRIKRNNRLASIPIIMLTAKDDRTTEAASIKAGVDAFMSKPFVSDMLMARVKQLLKSKEILRSNLRIEGITTVKDENIKSAEEKMLAEVTKVIEDNISDSDMNVGYVCEKTGLSSKQLYRLLKNLTGVSPVDYIRQIRMKKAAMLLQQRKFTVSEVMYMVGFSSTSYFSKCFSAQFGCTPRQYAEKQ